MGVLVEVPVMLSLVWIMNRTKVWSQKQNLKEFKNGH